MGIILKDLTRSLGTPPQQVIKGISIQIRSGEFISITGRSGSGKSTLLYLMSTLDRPTTGSVEIDGHDVGKMADLDLHKFRNEQMGFVFQFHYLLPEITALDNILMPARKTHREKEFVERAKNLMNEFGLESKYMSRPGELSGGEQQRVAVARALIMHPKYVFADEPTGNLDSVSGNVVMGILKKVSKDHGTTVITVTHDAGYAAMADRRITLSDGRLA